MNDDEEFRRFVAARLLSDDNSESSLDAGRLTVYQPGVFNPDVFTSGTPVTVQGRPGWQTTLSSDVQVMSRDNPAPTTQTITAPALAWQYADGAWAVIASIVDDDRYGIPAAEQLTLAAAFTTGTPVTATAICRCPAPATTSRSTTRRARCRAANC